MSRQLPDFTQPAVMGILNLTPDSFYDGGKYNDENDILRQVEKMLREGATIIDVGGMSSRPGAEFVAVEEEKRRVLPVLEAIAKRFPEAVISVDTIRAAIAREAVELGASIINDISGGRFDKALIPEVGRLGVAYVLMHMQGKPKTMQDAPQYTDVIQAVNRYFEQKIEELHRAGVERIILDPGFGFGKTIGQNYKILKNIAIFNKFGLPLLAGISRKSMIYRYLNIQPQEALNGTTALHMVALLNGVKILRVHDVKEAVEAVRLWKMLVEV